MENLFRKQLIFKKFFSYDALIWLKNHNHLYKNVEINKKNLDLLPDNDVPQVLINTIKLYDNKLSEDGYVKDPLKEETSRT